MPKKTYKRIILKISGEALAKEGQGKGIHQATLHDVAGEIKKLVKKGVQVAIVVGGGNIWRYRDTKGVGIERTASDTMGMLATIMNAVALQAALEGMGVFTRVTSAIQVPQVAEPYIRRRAMRHLEKGRVVICAGGTGNPFFTTDSAAALRALELGCQCIYKATNVDGVFDKDPNTHKGAKLYKKLTHKEAIEKHLNIMDQAAFSLCQDNNLPICVFNFTNHKNLLKAVHEGTTGTMIRSNNH